MPMAARILENPAARRVSILGATGSIGKSSLSVIDHAQGRYRVAALTAMENVDSLIEMARQYRPELAVIGNPAHYETLKAALAGTGIQAAAGDAALVEAAQCEADIVISAMVGAAGLKPTLAAIARGCRVALANKECLVVAGALMMRAVKKHQATLIPVDSEHSAIFQVFDMRAPESVEKVTVTASGGPFRQFTHEQMRNVTPAQAVAHPNWSMGAKISVDSATMMNKGLELIEAFHLFPLKLEQLEVLVHPESIIHSLVTYIDGSVLAQLGMPDMRTPIAYALAWPERLETQVKRLDLAQLRSLNFEPPDERRFPALKLARSALAAGGGATIVLNAANEIAVQAFLEGRAGFLDIAAFAERALEKIDTAIDVHSLEEILALDAKARQVTHGFLT